MPLQAIECKYFFEAPGSLRLVRDAYNRMLLARIQPHLCGGIYGAVVPVIHAILGEKLAGPTSTLFPYLMRYFVQN